MAKKSPRRSAAEAQGWRSGLEDSVGEQLRLAGVKHRYETFAVPYLQPPKPRRYTPDFALENGIVIETKGRFVTADRQKHLLVKEQYPELDIRFVFSNPRARISKQSKTTYAVWCESHGFLYARESIPAAWLHEPVNSQSLATVRRLMKEKKNKS